jgi:hypothetical protein
MNNKQRYLREIQEFVEFLSQHIAGRLTFSVPHEYCLRESGRQVSVIGLREAFREYEWKGKNYEENREQLEQYKTALRAAVNRSDDHGTYDACVEILEWGGVARKNVRWLDRTFGTNHRGLSDNLKAASWALLSSDPVFSRFAKRNGYRMNAGHTKIYALLNDNFAIYDGRVGAALGYLVTEYLRNSGGTSVPESLSFRWGKAQGDAERRAWRNPSQPENGWDFKSLGHQPTWAQDNVRANWLLTAVLEQAGEFAGANNRQESLRRLEAALFTIGYDFPQLDPRPSRTT